MAMVKVTDKDAVILVGTMLAVSLIYIFCIFWFDSSWFFILFLVFAMVMVAILSYSVLPTYWQQLVIENDTSITYFLKTRRFTESTHPLTKAKFDIFLRACETMCARVNNQIAVKYLENKAEYEEGYEPPMLPGQFLWIKIRPNFDYSNQTSPFTYDILWIFKSIVYYWRRCNFLGMSCQISEATLDEINILEDWTSMSPQEREYAELKYEIRYLECCIQLSSIIDSLFDARGNVRKLFRSKRELRQLFFLYGKWGDILQFAGRIKRLF